MNKKGDLELIKGLVIIILAGVVVGYFALNIMNVFEKNVDDDVCKTAVNLASIKVGPDVASVRVLSDEKKIAKNCRPTIRHFEKDTDVSKVGVTLVKDMVNCWDNFGEAKVNFLSSSYNTGLFCLPCSFYRSEEDIELDTGRVIGTLENKYPGLIINLAVDNTLKISPGAKIKELSNEGMNYGFYIIYIASTDGFKSEIKKDGKIVPLKKSKVQSRLTRDPEIYVMPRQGFYNPKIEEDINNNFFGTILVSDDIDLIKYYCGNYFYQRYLIPIPSSSPGEMISEVLGD